MIHKYTMNGFYIVLDVHSGSVSVVDQAAYRLLDYLSAPMEPACPQELLDKLSGEFPKEDLISAYEELYALYDQGLLFSEDDYAQFADKMVQSPVKAMCLHIAHDCNLR